jgi:hypothetical protein
VLVIVRINEPHNLRKKRIYALTAVTAVGSVRAKLSSPPWLNLYGPRHITKLDAQRFESDEILMIVSFSFSRTLETAPHETSAGPL